MIVGVNRVFEHSGKEYHLQAEDLGLDDAAFEVRVFDGGTILFKKKVPYGEVLSQNLPKLEQEDALRALMEKTVHTVQAAIAKGKLG